MSDALEECLALLERRSFYHEYRDCFSVVRAEDESAKQTASRLLHDVYQAQIVDEHEPRAAYWILYHQPSERPVGAVRIILPDHDTPRLCLPMQTVCDDPTLRAPERIRHLCEITHMCMIGDFRRRDSDGPLLPAYEDQDWFQVSIGSSVQFLRRRIPFAPVGLLCAAFETALENRIPDCVWTLDPDSLAALNHLGLRYRTLGPAEGEWGECRRPILINILLSLEAMRDRNPSCWDIVSDQGRLHDRAERLLIELRHLCPELIPTPEDENRLFSQPSSGV